MNIAQEQKSSELITDMRRKFAHVECFISWGKIAEVYFERSPGWIYQKLKGINSNGGVGGFTSKEAEQLRGAFNDLADQLRSAAAQI